MNDQLDLEMKSAPNIPDFIDGQRDCKEGNQADSKRSESYHRGYAAEYQLEANMEAKSNEQERINC
jgi:hypothetical protein